MKRIEKIAREQATLVAGIIADCCCVDEKGNLMDMGVNCNNCIFNQYKGNCNSLMADWLLEEVAE